MLVGRRAMWAARVQPRRSPPYAVPGITIQGRSRSEPFRNAEVTAPGRLRDALAPTVGSRRHPGVGAGTRQDPGGCPVNVPFVALGAGARRPVRVVRRRPGRRRGLSRRALTRAGLGVLALVGVALAGAAGWIAMGGDPAGLAALVDTLPLPWATADADLAEADGPTGDGVPLRVTTQPPGARGSVPRRSSAPTRARQRSWRPPPGAPGTVARSPSPSRRRNEPPH